MNPAERFEARIVPVPESGCWLWVGAWHRQWKYGRFRLNGKNEGAHRASYQLHVGPIPEGMCVCHKCDTPPCVNPDHLFIGSSAENNADMGRKGRSKPYIAVGQKHPRAKLSEVQAVAIFHDPRGLKAISDEFGISQPTVFAIKNGDRWKHLNLLERAA